MERLDQKPPVSRYAFVIVALAFLVNFIANYPQYQLSPLSHLVMPALNIDIAQFSSLFSSAMIPGILLGLIAGLLCDKYGTKACVGVAGLISLAGVIARIFATSFTAMFVCMLLSGVVATFLNANIAKIVGSWFPPEKISVMVGIAVAGATASMAVAMGTSALFPSLRAAYIAAAILSAVVLLLWFLFMKNKPSDAKAGEAAQMPRVSLKECLLTLVRIRHIWIVGLALGFVLAASMCLSTFLPQALQSVRGIDAKVAGAMSSAIMFGNLFGAVLGPAICAKIGRMKPFLFVSCILAGIGAAFAWQAPVGFALIAALFLTGFIASGVISLLISVPVMLKGVGPIFAGTAGGLVGTIQLICGVVIPSYIIAPAVGDNFTVLYLIAGGLALVAALLVLTIPELFGKGKATQA